MSRLQRDAGGLSGNPLAGGVFDVTVTALVYGGDAMGRLPDGRAVFVPYAIPGETVRVRLLEEKRGFARAELLDVLSPAAERLPPRCKTYAACGGCHYQHMPYAMQLDAKRQILAEQLKRIGNQANPPVQAIVPSPKDWHYRNHVQFHISPDGKLGFEQPGTNHVVPLEDCGCPLCEEPLEKVIPFLDIESMPGLERVGLRLGAGEEIMLVLEGSSPEAPEFTVEDLPLSAVYISPYGVDLLAGSSYLYMEALGREFRVSAESFFQVNTPQAAAMVEHLVDFLPITSDTTVLELYSGVGLFSAFLAGRSGRLVAVESSPSAVSDFEANLDEFDHVEIYEAPAEVAISAISFKPEIVLADPPRSGLGKDVIAGLTRLEPQTLAYVSCDPATLARDARFLSEAGYLLETITPFDMFPQTYHIESISFWRRT